VNIHERVAAGRQRLREAGLSENESGLGARLLAEHVLGWTEERFLVDAGAPEPDEFHERYEALVGRRADREPLSYIVGRREFWGLEFEVSPDVLIPRPETELIVEAALDLCPGRDAPIAVMDVGTGSGCVAVSIARERPAARATASDISEAALAVARRNAARLGVAERVHFVRTDLMDGVENGFDLIVANPPYVRDRDRFGLQPEVAREPAVALYGGSNGLDTIARLLMEAPTRLRPGASLVFEFGCGQEIDVEALIDRTTDLAFVGFRRDLQGLARTAVARRR
jgi:release factor glutamine methyltransferase